MYVQTCAGGYPNPVGALNRRVEILGFKATVNTPGAVSRVQMWDDEALDGVDKKMGLIVAADYSAKTKFLDSKGVDDVDANLECLFPEPIKLRRGLSIAYDNIVAGSFMLYVK